MRHVAVIGSGPAGYYSAEALQKQFGDDVRIDMIDRMPVPYGLIRFGVAPDHQSIKAVSRRYEKVALSDNVRFVGNVLVGRDVTIPELVALYDAVILATGAPDDRPLDIPGGDLSGVVGSAAFVGWYNGHPEFADLDPPLGRPGRGGDRQRQCRARRRPHPRQDAGRVRRLRHRRPRLRRARQQRDPHDPRARPPRAAPDRDDAQGAWRARPPRRRGAASSSLADFPPVLDDALLEPGQRKSVTHLREFADLAGDKSKTIVFDFFAKPVRVEGDGKVERLIVEKTRLDERAPRSAPARLMRSTAAWSSPASATRRRRSRACPMRRIAAASPMPAA